MRKLLVLTLLATTSCATAPAKLVADKSLIPALPPAPVDLSRPLGPEVLPQLHCLQQTGSPRCPGTGSSTPAGSAT